MTDQKEYPHITSRIKAAFADSVVILVFMLIITSIFSTLTEVPDWARIAAFVFVFGLYDPIFTSLFGGTIGHMIFRIRVKREKDETKNISLPFAIIRFLIKVLLGFISLLTVGANQKRKAIHDSIARSVVIYN